MSERSDRDTLRRIAEVRTDIEELLIDVARAEQQLADVRGRLSDALNRRDELLRDLGLAHPRGRS